MLATVLVLGASVAQAGIIMNIWDDGTDLYMSATGSYDLTNVASVAVISLGANAAIAPTFPIFGWETGTSANYSAAYSGVLTGTSNVFPASSTTTTNPFFFYNQVSRISFQTSAPTTGVVNEFAVFLGSTLATVGMVNGESIQVSWGRGGANEVATINVSAPAPVPEPATLLLLGGGLVAAGVRRYRRRSA